MNNLELPNENGDGIITTATTKNANENECEDIGKLKNRKYFRNYAEKHKDVLKQYRHNYNKQNKDRIHKQKRSYYQQNKKRIKRKNDKNKIRRNFYNKQYYIKNKSEIIIATCKRFKRRYKSDILFRIKHLLRTRIGDLCKGRCFIKSETTMKLLGCDLSQFKLHMENLFKPKMTWNNHGKLGWHIDHIIPLNSAKNQQELEKLCHYKNLQPLWWYDNLSKGGNIITANNKGNV